MITLITAVILIFTGRISSGQRQEKLPDKIYEAYGPIHNTGMAVVVDKAGVHTNGYRFRNDLNKKSPWQAQWINIGPQPLENNKSINIRTNSAANVLRKEFVLQQKPQQVHGWITAEGRYRLYVNGHLASRGPADAGRDYTGVTSGKHLFDCRDLTSFFRSGKNVVAVEIFGGQAGFLFEAEIIDKSEIDKSEIVETGLRSADNATARSVMTLKSDATWRGIQASYLVNADWMVPPGTQSRPSRSLQFEGAQEPIGWQASGFDDAKWPYCHPTKGISEPLAASEIPPLMEARYPLQQISRATAGLTVPDHPFRNGQSLVLKRNASFAVHFNRVLSAHYGIRVKGGAGALIALQASETNAPGYNRMVSLLLRDGEQTFESPEIAAVGTLNVIVSNVTTPVEIEDIWANTVSQPLPYRGAFTCSDTHLNAIWNACRWATQINLQTHHLDSLDHQEPICDYGDYLIEDLVNYCAFGEPWLARQDLRKFAWVMEKSHYQTFHTSYILLWLQTLVAYYQYTGDKALIIELAPDVHAIIDQFTLYRGKNGILSEAPNYMFMDWVTIAGFGCHHPPAVIGQGYMTAFYYRALEDAIHVSEWTGDMSRIQRYTDLRKGIVEAYNRELWSKEQGLYRDGKPFQTTVKPNEWLPADKDIETFSAQNNVLAVLYDLAPKERQTEVIERVLAQKPWNVRPYYMHFVLHAIDHAGLFDRYGTEWMRKWNIVPETQSFYEMGDSGDLSHAWIATPLYQMSAHILGITPAAPGYKLISIRPELCDLLWAKGSVPTPYGNTEVSWRRESGRLMLTVTVPRNAQAEVAVPLGKTGATVSLGSKMLWQDGHTTGKMPVTQQQNALLVRLPAGKYEFLSTGIEMPIL